MRSLLLNLVLALIWGAMTGTFQFENLAIGFALGFGALFVVQRRGGRPAYAAKVVEVLGFVVFYLRELWLANVRVAYDVFATTLTTRPGILAIRVDAMTDAEITLLANLLTMTPGELSIDVSTDRRTLYVHSLYLYDVERSRHSIEGFKARVLAVMR